jgi:hypothetical protein
MAWNQASDQARSSITPLISPPTRAVNAFSAMIADPNRQQILYWPSLYCHSKNKAAIRDLANDIIMAGSGGKQQYGGFSSSEI